MASSVSKKKVNTRSGRGFLVGRDSKEKTASRTCEDEDGQLSASVSSGGKKIKRLETTGGVDSEESGEKWGTRSGF